MLDVCIALIAIKFVGVVKFVRFVRCMKDTC